jgi:hypothetical protein
LSGTVFPEVKYNKNEATLDVFLASKAIFSSRATTIVEPFPSFFLKHNEIRTKRGYLDNVK